MTKAKARAGIFSHGKFGEMMPQIVMGQDDDGGAGKMEWPGLFSL